MTSIPTSTISSIPPNSSTQHRHPRTSMLLRWFPIAVFASALALLPSCVLIPPRAGSLPAIERLSNISTTSHDLYAPLTIRWDSYSIPFIEAQDDRDVPYALGIIHGHLRLGQMQVLRMLAYGRLAEIAGPIPIVVDIDHTLRAIDFAGSAQRSLEATRSDTRQWLERFAQGINAQAKSMSEPTIESQILDVDTRPFTPQDILAIGRVAGTDINWGRLGQYLLSVRAQTSPTNPLPPDVEKANQQFLDLFSRERDFGNAATPSFGPNVPQPLSLLNSISKSGSNSVVLAGWKRAGLPAPSPDSPPDTRNPAIIANDPHVGFTLPALWMIAGYRSPSHQALGFMIPGLPVVLLGRNETIAWGGTNMLGLATAMYDVSAIPPNQRTTKTITINRRFFTPTTRTITTTPFGPIMTDLPLFKSYGKDIAWRWRGQDPSDEISAFLDVSRAQSFEQFRKAFEPYAVSGQNFLYADTAGNIGQVIALGYTPAAGRIITSTPPIGDVNNPLHAWTGTLNPTQLPFGQNPPTGYLISANNTPVKSDPPITLFTNANDRVNRFEALLSEPGPFDVNRLAKIQLDVYSIAAHKLAKDIVARSSALTGPATRLRSTLQSWDGNFHASSKGPLALHAIVVQLAQAFYADRYGSRGPNAILGSSAVYDFVRQDLAATTDSSILFSAMNRAAEKVNQNETWGDKHTLTVGHIMSNLPVLGGLYTFDRFGVDGNTTTIFKTAADVTDGPSNTRYGANARHITDLAHPDENYFVIMGGQDGWLGSQNFADQVDLWKAGKLIKIPFSAQAIPKHFTTIQTFTPSAQPLERRP